jgi:phytanoyl-CoA hydroxylase
MRTVLSADRPIDPARAPAFVDLQAVATHRNAQGEPAFPDALVPWIDRPDADVDAYVRALPETPAGYDLVEALHHWRRDGYVLFEQAISHQLIDQYLADMRELVANHHAYDVLLNHNVRGIAAARDLTPEELSHPRLRVMDFHNASVAGKKLALSRKVVSFLGHVFREPVVGMQTLTFYRGSQQEEHQDYAYVVSGNPAHLAASWIALEDVHPDAGPLGYFPGSHRIPKFDFGNGLFMTPESPRREVDFLAHIRAQCTRLGLQEKLFLAKKGDVFVWHGALVHRGSPVRDPALTRLSLATHYSSASGYPRDRRNIDVVPECYVHNDAIVYGDPVRPRSENVFGGGEAIQD